MVQKRTISLNIQKIASEILKSCTLDTVQQEAIMDFVRSDTEMSYQDMAHFLSPKVNANPHIIYDFLRTRDRELFRDNDTHKLD